MHSLLAKRAPTQLCWRETPFLAFETGVFPLVVTSELAALQMGVCWFLWSKNHSDFWDLGEKGQVQLRDCSISAVTTENRPYGP